MSEKVISTGSPLRSGFIGSSADLSKSSLNHKSQAIELSAGQPAPLSLGREITAFEEDADFFVKKANEMIFSGALQFIQVSISRNSDRQIDI